MDGLGSLYSPVGNAYLAGQQMTQDDANNQKSALANQLAAMMNPLTAQHQQLTNQTLEAQLPGVVGQSQVLASQGKVATAGVDDQIASQHSKALTGMSDDSVKQLSNRGQMYAQFGATLEKAGVPPPAMGAAIQNLAPQFGLSADDPIIQHVIKAGSADPSQIPSLLSNIGTDIAKTATSHIQARDLTQMKEAGDTARTAMTVGASEDNNRRTTDTELKIAQMKIEAEKMLKMAAQENDPIKALTILGKVPPALRDANWQSHAKYLATIAVLQGQARQNQTTPSIINGQTAPTTDDILKNITGMGAPTGTPTPQPQAPTAAQGPTPQAGSPAEKAAVESAGFSYEPDKYEYKYNPDTRQMMRRKKQ